MRVGIETADLLSKFLLGNVGRQINTNRFNAYLRTIAMLASDVLVRGRVLPDEHGAQSRYDTLIAQDCYAFGQFGLDRGGSSLAVEFLGGHGSSLCHDLNRSLSFHENRVPSTTIVATSIT